MPNPQIFVPYSVQRSPHGNEPFKLYTVQCGEVDFGDGWKIYYDADREDKEGKPERKKCMERLSALKNLIDKKDGSRIFLLEREGEDDMSLHDDTLSAFLGLYLTLYQDIEDVKFNADWTTITVTGDIKIENGVIKLSKVDEIPDKFEDFKKDIKINPRDKHLFVYVSGKKVDEVKDGKNIRVKHFFPNDSIESVRNYVFERQYEDDLQKFLCTNIRAQTRNIEYIPTQAYLNIEADIGEKILSSEIKGCFIWGEGESGKSETAEALARHLMMVDTKIYAPIWIKIEDDLKGNKRDDITLEGPAIKYITEKISKKVEEKKIKISDLKEFLKKHQYLLVIDNLEFDNKDLNEVLEGIKSIKEDMQLNWPYLIITSRTSCTASIANKMGLESIKSRELCKEDIEIFFDTIIGSDISLAEIKQKETYPEFIDALYEHYRSFPGLIIPAIGSIKKGKTMESLLPELKSIRTEGIDEKALIIFRAVFSMLDESSQAVLFTLLDEVSPDTTIGQDKLIEAVKEKAAVPGLLIPGMAERALDNLVNNALIYGEASVEDELPRYGMKGVPFLVFVFGDIFTGQGDAEKKKNLRGSLVRNTWRLQMALRYERSAEIIDELESDIGDPLELGYIYYQEAMFRNSNEYITKSIYYYRKALDDAKPWSERCFKAALQYLQASNWALKTKKYCVEFIEGVFVYLDKKIWIDLLLNEYFHIYFLDYEFLNEIGDAYRFWGDHSKAFKCFEQANKAYENALRYSQEIGVKAIRATKIKQVINLSEWSNLLRNKQAVLEQAKNILTDASYFDIIDVNPENDPLEYADKEMALANIYLELSHLNEYKKYKEKSIASYINARDIYAKEKYRIKYGLACAELSVAYMTCTPSVEDINKSIEACKEALKIFHKNDFPMYYAETMNHLGNAYKAFVKEKNEPFFKYNLWTFQEAEKIFQEGSMFHFMIGRVKHNIGDLHYKYALNPSLDNKKKVFLLRKSIDIFKEANEIRKKYPKYHISTLLFQGRACLGLAEILPDGNEEKVQRLKEAIETFEKGIAICIDYSIQTRYDYKWLNYNNCLARYRLYKITQDFKVLHDIISYLSEAMEYADDVEKERMRIK